MCWCQVGINTETPQEMLDVNGRVRLADSENIPSSGTIRYNDQTKNFEGFNGVNWQTFNETQTAPEFVSYGQGESILIWFNNTGATNLPSYLQELESQMRIFVVAYSVENGLNSCEEAAHKLLYFFQNFTSNKIVLGGNSYGAGVALNAVVNYNFQPDALLIYYPQSTWNLPRFIEVLQNQYPNWQPTQTEINQYNTLLYGTLNPATEQMLKIDFLKPINVPVWFKSYSESFPTNMDQVLHNRAHTVALCEQTTDCHINENIQNFINFLNN